MERIEHLASFELAAKRTQWAALALERAAEELHTVGEQGALVLSAERLSAAADLVGRLLPDIEADRKLAANPHRVTDAL